MKARRILLALMLLVALAGCSGNGAKELLETAKLEELQNNPSHAKKLYEEILQKYPDSPYAKEAKERLGAMGTKK